MDEIKVIIYCPGCFYRITRLQKTYATINLDCPGCGKYKFGQFQTVRWKHKKGE